MNEHEQDARGAWLVDSGTVATSSTAWTPWQFVWAVGLPGWLVLTLVQLLTVVLTTMQREDGFVAVPMAYRFAQILLLAAVVVPVYRLALALPWRAGTRAAAVTANAALAIIVALANRPALLFATLPFADALNAQAPKPGPPMTVATWLHMSLLEGWARILWITTTLSGLVAYLGGLGLMLGLRAALGRRDERLRSKALHLAWTQARLQALRMQLKPHFLFNALNTIVGLMDTEPARARAVIVRLGDLLRRTLAGGDREWSCLADELAFARDYMAIQQARFGERLSFTVESPPAADVIAIPAMLLQPLVENAVIHGVADDRDHLSVWIHAQVLDDGARLHLEIGNRSSGALAEGRARGGVGLGTTRDRLAAIYGDRATVTAGIADASTFRLRLDLPTRLADPPPSGEPGR
ncbi:MAG: histidine kinase [Steroidobacteraceae bacterium]